MLGASLPVVIAYTENIETSSSPIRDGTVLYVGGSGPGNYTKIQDAIDAATEGDTIFVYDDSSPYLENVMVNKSVHLMGEHRETTEINGGGNEDVIVITKDFVTLSDFTLKEPDWYYDGVILSANNTVLTNLSIVNTGYAFTTRNAHNNIFKDIEISAGRDGMRIVFSDSNVFQRVTFTDNYIGYMAIIQSNRNTISDCTFACGSLAISQSNNNTIQRNTFLASTGLSLFSANDNLIEENTFENPMVSSSDSYRNTVHNNMVNGKPLVYLEGQQDQIVDDAGQVILIHCEEITVQNLEIISNGTEASISIQESADCIISDNVLLGGWYSIIVDTSKNILVSNNTIQNTRYGILDMGGRKNVYSHNMIQNNQYSGLALDRTLRVRVEKNTFIDNPSIAIVLAAGFFNTISGNTIKNNYLGIELEYTTFNSVKNNNFIQNKANAVFGNALRTHWSRNYWDIPRPIPKIIVGAFILPSFTDPWGETIIPFINIDKTPRLLPYMEL